MELIVYEDCMKLIQNFVKCGKVQFQDFCTKWRDLKFEHIWAAQTSYTELIQTTVAAFHVGKRLACGRRSNGQPIELSHAHLESAYRIGGIYLMYAIYFKQPTQCFTKIEVSLQSWNLMRIFIDVLQENASPGTNEVRYIFWKLVQAKAFRFTAHDFDLGVEGLVDFDNPPTKLAHSTANRRAELRDDIPNIAYTEKMLPSAEMLETRYNEMKQQLSHTEGANAESLPARSSIMKDLQQTFDNIAKILKGEPPAKTNEKNNIADTSDFNRRSIKRKAYKLELQNSQYSQDDLQSSDDTDDNHQTEALNSSTSANNIERRQSSRTIFKNTLPKSINNEVEEEYDNDSESDEESKLTSIIDSILD